MLRLGAMLLAAILFLGCSNTTPETEPANTPESTAPDENSSATNEPSTSEPSADTPDTDAPEIVAPESEAVESNASLSPAEAAAGGIAVLEAEYKKSMNAFMQKVQAAPQDEQMDLFMTRGESAEFANEALKLAGTLDGTPEEFDALAFAAANGDAETVATSFKTIGEKFADDERLTAVIAKIGSGMDMPSQSSFDFLTTIVDNSTSDAIKGVAEYSRYTLITGAAELKQMVDSEPDMAGMVSDDSMAFIDAHASTPAEELEATLTRIAENYADVEMGRTTIGEKVEGELFVLQNLSIGKVAPEIDGIDLDDAPFKLSDYRGKVVMLDFWGDW